ncbi:hypothetical protein [Comamonas sp. C24C]
MDSSNLKSFNQKIYFIIYSLLFILFCVVFLIFINNLEFTDNSKLNSIVKSTNTIVENLIAGGVAAIILTLISDLILSFVDPKNKVEEISSSKISARLKLNANNTNNYLFIGNTASFVTKEIIPILFRKSFESHIKKNLSIYLLNPKCNDALEAYVSYKNRILFSDSKGNFSYKECSICEGKKTSVDDVISTILCTIYMAAYVSQSNYVEVNVFFRSYFTPFRADISDVEVVLTQESKKDPAVGFSERGQFFYWYKKEADVLIYQSKKIDLNFLKLNNESTKITSPNDSNENIESSMDYLFGEVDFLKCLKNDLGSRYGAIRSKAVECIKDIHWRKNAI